MSDRIVPNIIWFQKQKKLNTLNNIAGQLKGVLFDLRACNFVHAKISLRARCVYARHRVCNLSSPVEGLSSFNATLFLCITTKLLSNILCDI